MADKKAAAKSKSTGKAEKPGRKLSALYAFSGEKVERKNKFCPTCGPGTFMAAHKDRVVCGKCRYVEYRERKG